MESSKPTLHRCAIYTRKSSEEGLEQEFNSLHAQRRRRHGEGVGVGPKLIVIFTLAPPLPVLQSKPPE
jgi:hypothetical protein